MAGDGSGFGLVRVGAGVAGVAGVHAARPAPRNTHYEPLSELIVFFPRPALGRESPRSPRNPRKVDFGIFNVGCLRELQEPGIGQ